MIMENNEELREFEKETDINNYKSFIGVSV